MSRFVPGGSIPDRGSEDSLLYVYRDPIDPILTFLYKPRTLSVLIALLLWFLYLALFQSADSSTVNNTLQ